MPRVWFITGASSGFGRLMVELALLKGEAVVATLRNPDALCDLTAQYDSEKLLLIKLDVTRPDDVEAAFLKAKEKFGRIDVVFNNAGYTVIAEVEGTRDGPARNMFETNFWGAANVSREAVKFFREVNNPVGGRLIVTSSVTGVNAVPSAGYYCASKYALEGLTQALAAELDPEWNTKITLVEPFTFKTRGQINPVIYPAHAAYQKPTLITNIARKYIVKGVPAADASKAVEKIFDLSLLDAPPLRLVLGKGAVKQVKAKAAEMLKNADEFEGWSKDLVPMS